MADSANGDSPRPWIVWRQDDNGNCYGVRRFESRADADALAAELESRGHRQLYWVAAAGQPPREVR